MKVLVRGRVQGVGFRWICAQEARSRGVAGHVRNLPDGAVEASFEGSTDAVEAMVAWCRHGPEWAVVESVEVTEEPAAGESDFTITR